jgi:hypothetical protein
MKRGEILVGTKEELLNAFKFIKPYSSRDECDKSGGCYELSGRSVADFIDGSSTNSGFGGINYFNSGGLRNNKIVTLIETKYFKVISK